MSPPPPPAVRLDGNQNFLAVFGEQSTSMWCQSEKSLFLYHGQEAEPGSDLLCQGQGQAVSQGTRPRRTTEER